MCDTKTNDKLDISDDDWQVILRALKTYVIIEETKLTSSNVGDKEWNELSKFENLIREIEYYLIGAKQ